MSNLREQTLNGLIWSFARLFSVQITMFIVQLYLARFLLPEAFGLIAMLQIFIAIAQTLMDGGMSSSLIRSKNVNQLELSTVFFMNIFTALILYFLLYISAGSIANFYNQSKLESILKVLGLSIIIQSLVTVQLAKLTKELNFKIQFILELPAVLLSCFLAIWMAFNGLGVWSLVWLGLSKTVIFTFLVWVFSGWKPSIQFHWGSFKHHFNFGYKLTLSGILNTIFDNIYNVIIGRFFNASLLGFYDRANTFRNLPVQTISGALNKVTYPMFASIQDDNSQLKRVYKSLMVKVLFIVSPMMVLASVVAEPLFVFLLTEKWIQAVSYFKILCYASILYPLHSFNLNIVNVKGRSDLFLRLEIIKKIIVSIVVFFAIPFGIEGLILGQLITTNLAFFINTYFSGRLINYDVYEQIKDISPIICISIIVGIIVSFFNTYVTIILIDNLLLEIFLNGFFYILIYLLICFIFRLAVFFEIKNFILKL